MAKNQTKKLSPATLAEDLQIYAALKDISDYKPSNPAYTQAALDALRANLNTKAEADAQAAAAAAAAAVHDDHIAAEWGLHNGFLARRTRS